jgi:hypothetical protein
MTLTMVSDNWCQDSVAVDNAFIHHERGLDP